MKPLVMFFLVLVLCSIQSFAQPLVRKKLSVFRIEQPVKIDGILDEDVYLLAETANDFVQLTPYNGQPSYKQTEVKVLYDDHAIYIGAMIYDDPDSVASYITTRDNIGGSDYFLVMIDPNNEGLLSYEFLVTPSNSQTDLKGIRGTGGDYEDESWNAVWQSETQMLDNGWSVEIRIPYSAIRFPVKDEMVWGINFFRNIRRYNSNNSWNHIDFKISGFLHQTGELYGLRDIKAPFRLSISPYIAAYVENQSGNNDFVYKGGLDLKYGVSESHTLDMMLIPDFGQIQSDDQQLNLSPYELYYDEKRQFFVEGNDLFERANIFYSRRIGSRPIFMSRVSDGLNHDEMVKYNPSQTQLVNASKFTGRDKNGWGIGVMNAMTLPARAQIENIQTGAVRDVLTQPFTNYNVAVIEKVIPNNSYISLINTNMSLANDPYSANVTATQFQIKNKSQSHQLMGIAGASHKRMADNKTGYGYVVSMSKIKGNFRYSGRRSVFSNTLDFNDMGYLRRNNTVEHYLQAGYNIYEPFSIFKYFGTYVWWDNSSLFEPSKHIVNELNVRGNATFKNNWGLALYYTYNFGENDYFEPRSTNNRHYSIPAYHNPGLNFSTDYNKKLTFYSNIGANFMDNTERWGNWLNHSLALKASSRFTVSYSNSINNEINAKGYVSHLNNDSIFFSTYQRATMVNTLSMNYVFNTKTGIEFRGRQYRSIANYDNLLLFLEPDGSLSPKGINPDVPDMNFNAFNIDMVFKWEFAPGSEMSVVWKNAIYHGDKLVGTGFTENLRNTFNAAQINSLSVKILYYIDVNTALKKKPMA
jgi:hypothetical protein